jgi:hypothetical protein
MKLLHIPDLKLLMHNNRLTMDVQERRRTSRAPEEVVEERVPQIGRLVMAMAVASLEYHTHLPNAWPQ